MRGPLLAVDGPSLLYRAFFALPDSIRDADGRPVNALLGMTNLLLLVIERHRPRATVLCFGLDAARYRVERYAPYHADRPPVPDDLAPQFADAEAFFGAFGWRCVDTDELEADDLLHSYALAEERAGGSTLILTGDRDLFQCATERTTILYVKTGTKGVEEVDPAEVRRRYGVPPELVPDFIALRGDPSDGIPGAKGVGEKGAADLLRRHGSLEGALAAWAQEPPRVRAALHGQAEELRAFRRMATLQPIEIVRPPDRPTDFSAAAEAAQALGMRRLAERLRGLAAA
jgi:DNA polymerase-1